MKNYPRRRRALETAATDLVIMTAAACSPIVHVATEREGARAADEEIGVTVHVRTEGVAVSIANHSDSPVHVLWQRWWMVDTEGRASRIVHGSNHGYRKLRTSTTASHRFPRARGSTICWGRPLA